MPDPISEATMKLNEEQIARVQTWATEGLALGEIQKRLNEEFQLGLTYMEARLLISDLDVSLHDRERSVSRQINPDRATEASPLPGGLGDDDDEGMGGGVQVSLHDIAKPNAMVSGKVRFSDGETAEWSIDQLGRLGLVTATPGYQPSELDIIDFQRELESVVRQAGL